MSQSPSTSRDRRLLRDPRTADELALVMRWHRLGLLAEWVFRRALNSYCWREALAVGPRAVLCLSLQCVLSGDRHLYIEPSLFVNLTVVNRAIRSWAAPRLGRIMILSILNAH